MSDDAWIGREFTADMGYQGRVRFQVVAVNRFRGELRLQGHRISRPTTSSYIIERPFKLDEVTLIPLQQGLF